MRRRGSDLRRLPDLRRSVPREALSLREVSRGDVRLTPTVANFMANMTRVRIDIDFGREATWDDFMYLLEQLLRPVRTIYGGSPVTVQIFDTEARTSFFRLVKDTQTSKLTAEFIEMLMTLFQSDSAPNINVRKLRIILNIIN